MSIAPFNQKIIIKNYGCLSGCGTILTLLIIFAFIGYLFSKGTKTTDKPFENVGMQSIEKMNASEELKIDIGQQQRTFGESEQAKTLLSLIENNPGKRGYQISYQVAGDSIVFSCDLTSGNLVRKYRYPSGHGIGERWSGTIIYRLKSASGGESLDDTPTGKMPGTAQAF
jgi:hypothetical protein